MCATNKATVALASLKLYAIQTQNHYNVVGCRLENKTKIVYFVYYLCVFLCVFRPYCIQIRIVSFRLNAVRLCCNLQLVNDMNKNSKNLRVNKSGWHIWLIWIFIRRQKLKRSFTPREKKNPERLFRGRRNYRSVFFVHGSFDSSDVCVQISTIFIISVRFFFVRGLACLFAYRRTESETDWKYCTLWGWKVAVAV